MDKVIFPEYTFELKDDDKIKEIIDSVYEIFNSYFEYQNDMPKHLKAHLILDALAWISCLYVQGFSGKEEAVKERHKKMIDKFFNSMMKISS